MKKINGLMSGIEQAFDEQDKKLDRLELAILGLYFLNVGIIGAAIYSGVFSNG
jgi:hypothetical protein